MGIKLSSLELASVFQEVDQDRSGTIDIDELYSFITTQNSDMGGIAM
jgi:Ca2+-binding EF-hand superfamily protein